MLFLPAFLGESSRGEYFENPSATKIVRAVAACPGTEQNTIIPVGLNYDEPEEKKLHETATDIGILGLLKLFVDAVILGRERKYLDSSSTLVLHIGNNLQSFFKKGILSPL